MPKNHTSQKRHWTNEKASLILRRRAKRSCLEAALFKSWMTSSNRQHRHNLNQRKLKSQRKKTSQKVMKTEKLMKRRRRKYRVF